MTRTHRSIGLICSALLGTCFIHSASATPQVEVPGVQYLGDTDADVPDPSDPAARAGRNSAESTYASTYSYQLIETVEPRASTTTNRSVPSRSSGRVRVLRGN